MKQTIEMASAAYKNEEGILMFQLDLEIWMIDLDIFINLI